MIVQYTINNLDKISTIDEVSQRSHGRGQNSAKDVAMREKLPHATLAKPLKVNQKFIDILIRSIQKNIFDRALNLYSL